MLDIVAKLSGKFNVVFSARQHNNSIMLSSRAKNGVAAQLATDD